jgi:hypothetical protein
MRELFTAFLIVISFQLLTHQPPEAEVRASSTETKQPKSKETRVLERSEEPKKAEVVKDTTPVQKPQETAVVQAEPQPQAVVQHPTNCEAYRGLISQYNWNVETMMTAMRLESGCNPGAVGDNYPIAGILAPSCGLLQVRTISPERGTCEQLKDPAFNIQKAYEIWLGQGYRAWTVLH